MSRDYRALSSRDKLRFDESKSKQVFYLAARTTRVKLKPRQTKRGEESNDFSPPWLSHHQLGRGVSMKQVTVVNLKRANYDSLREIR